MIGLAELLAKKAQYEHEKLFVEAKISVVDEMIAEERAKTAEEPITETEEVVEETTQQDESY
jgi:hypothetical protein